MRWWEPMSEAATVTIKRFKRGLLVSIPDFILSQPGVLAVSSKNPFIPFRFLIININPVQVH